MSMMSSAHSYQSSRDPAGVDPSGMDIITGADPPLDDESEDPPILPPSSPAGPPPPTPRRTHSKGNNNHSYRAPSPVMTFLVSNPPPPPTTPPPKKSPKRQHQQQYHFQQQPSQPMPRSPPGEASMPVSNASPNKQRHQWREQMQDYQHEKQHEAFSLVEQKRREAMAIYESPDLYLEPGEQQREEDFDQQPNISYTDSSSNSASLANAEFVDLDENEPPNQATTAFSPRSAATEPHSNKREATYKNKKGFSKRDSTGSQDSSSSSVNSSFDQKKTSGKKNKSEEPEEGATGENRRGRISTGGLRSKTPERRGRGRSLEKPSSADSPEKEKKGFFRKLFRGKKKSLGRMEDSHHSIEEEAAPDTDILPPNKMSSGPRVSFRPVHEQLNDDALSAHSSKARSVVSLEVETHQAGNVNNAGRSRDREQQELEFGLNTVTSGLTNDMDPERRDIFFAHDEVSTLTAPSAHSYGRRSIDPQEAGGSTGGNSSEPVGRYWNDGSNQKAQNSHNVTSPTIDPFTEPFFQEPDGESPITSKKVTRSKTPRQEDSLHVNVPTSLEPTGETPRAHANEPSPRGWQSPITELKDPTGSTYSATPRRSSTGEANNTSQKEHKDRKLCTKRKLPHELQREPSAFRDGPPYALDPPLRMHEFDDNGNPKSLIGILSKRPTTTKSNNDRVAAEPPTSTLTEQSRTQEVQPPTPTLRPEEKKEEEPTSPFDEPDKLVAPTTLAEEKAVTDAQFIPSKTTKEECKDDAGFLDELFQENTKNKKPSLVRPISITFANGSDSDKGTQPSSPQPHAAEIHRTQRLSISPRSCKDVSYTPEKLSEAKVGVAPSSTAHDLSAVLQRRRQHISNDEEEEEKKETESYHSHAIIEESSVSGMSDKMLATGTTALSTAASMNAQTVRYLHTLNGEPSPRHSWRRAELSDDEYSPVKSKVQRQAVANIKSAMSKKNFVAVCRSDEAAFENFISGKEKAITSTASGSNSLHQSKLVQKKPLNIRTRNKVGNLSPRSRKMAKENYKRPIHYFYQRCNRDVRVKGAPLSYGLELLRKQRQSAILSGRAIPVRPKKSLKKRSLASSQFQPLREEDIKDPIQRAGMRLLSKAAIPIQSAARKYLARREAESRLSAAIALQSYFRRWKCEAYLQGCRYTSTKIQAAFRSWMVREELAYQHFQATQIQKVVRSYIASAYVHDAIYWVARLQAVMRGKLSRTRLAKLKQLREMSALCLQSWYRGCVARKQVGKCIKAISTIQATCRSYAARVSYQVAVIDIIIVQGVVRQFLARKQLEKKQLEKMSNAACKIQATWRGFQGYTDYIFALVDILVIQRSMRKWLAKKKVDSMRKHLAATKIQAQWRRQTALIGMLYDLVHIIIAQSVIRRFLVQRTLPQIKTDHVVHMKEKRRLDLAATKIQTAWRGFWGYSHFIIMQYEIIRLQAIVRGRACRNLYSLKLGCCIMIQSAVRRFVANKKAHRQRIARVAQGAAVEGMRMRLACQRIQFWWRVVLECNKEKAAALVIERFFLMVKSEVDREIRRQRHMQPKSSRRPTRGAHQDRDHRSEDDEKLLERVWLNTVDEDHVDIFACNSKEGVQYGRSRRSKSAPRLHQNLSYISEPSKEPTPTSRGVQHRPSSPTMNLVMRYEDDSALRRELDLKARQEEALRASRCYQKAKSNPPPDVTLAKSDERTEVSAITSPTVFKMIGKNALKKFSKPQNSKELEDELSLEESLIGEEIQDEASTSLHSAPNHSSEKNHFFSDDKDYDVNGKYPTKKPLTRRHHSTSSIASGSDVLSEASDINTHMYSRTATTMTKTTHDETIESGILSQSHSEVGKGRRYTVRSSSDKYLSAASKGKKLLQEVRKGSKNVSPRHGRIVIQNSSYSDHPILSQDSHDNVEVEYVGQEFGMI